MYKRVFKSFTLLFAITIGLLLTGCRATNLSSTGENMVPEKVNIGVFRELNPELIVQYEDKYEEYLGTSVNIVYFDTSAEVNQAIASGDIDIANIGTTGAAIGLSKDLGYEVFWIYYVIGKAEALVVKADSGITGVSDLEGKRIGVPFAGTTHYSLLSALKEEKVDIDRVKLLNMKPDEIYAAWKRNDIDATYLWYPMLGKIIDDGGIIITDSEEMAKKGAITANVGIVRTEFSEKYPSIIEKYIKAQMYAHDEFSNNYDKAISEMAEYLSLDRDTAMKLEKGYIYPSAEGQLTKDYFGNMNEEGDLAAVLKSTAEFLKEQGSIDEVPDIDTFKKGLNRTYIEATLK